ncbi:hypothetical protein H0H81_009448 [Sphagnurus paluster]|uniref:Uncharacterized protein n=1 Tax=Sphagnurus paluster TaxID=117069 RepID=A0A9P7GIF8_9AGAR|nr:hypothetical protein H0H81_009448 [Sphagnurus paluster]
MAHWSKVCIPVPTAEGLQAALDFVGTTIHNHRFPSAALLFLWSYYPAAPFQAVSTVLYRAPRAVFRWILGCFGFGEDGPRADSFAARYQSTHYGGYVPQDSYFARYQSIAAREYPVIYELDDDEGPGTASKVFGWSLFLAGFVVLFGWI